MQHTRKTLASALNGTAAEPKEKIERDYAAEDASRTTTQMKVRVRQEVLDEVDKAASAFNMNRSEFLTNLILGNAITPTPGWEKASDNILLTIAGHKIMQAIAACTQRIQDEPTRDMFAELQLIRRQIVQGQLTIRPDYEAYLDSREVTGDKWTDSVKK